MRRLWLTALALGIWGALGQPWAYGQGPSLNPSRDCVRRFDLSGAPAELAQARQKLLATRPPEAVGLFAIYDYSIGQKGQPLREGTITECQGCQADPRQGHRMVNQLDDSGALKGGQDGQRIFQVTLQWNLDTGDDTMAKGVVQDQQGRHLAGAAIVLRRQDGQIYRTVSSSNGYFRQQVRSGLYQVTASKDGASQTQEHLLCAFGSMRAAALGLEYKLPFMRFSLRAGRCWRGNIIIKTRAAGQQGPGAFLAQEYVIKALVRAGQETSKVLNLKGENNPTLAKARWQLEGAPLLQSQQQTTADLRGTLGPGRAYRLQVSIAPRNFPVAQDGQSWTHQVAWNQSLDRLYFGTDQPISGQLTAAGGMEGQLKGHSADQGDVFSASLSWRLDPCPCP